MSRRFELHRDVDEGGVSGIGVVAEGVLFANGKACLGWGGKLGEPTVGVYDSMEQLDRVHGHGGLTRVVWVDPKDVSETAPTGAVRESQPAVSTPNSLPHPSPRKEEARGN